VNVRKEQLEALGEENAENLPLPSIPYVSPSNSFLKLGQIEYYYSGDADRS
jgi:hypothetical protein